jgi:hypothetical protein
MLHRVDAAMGDASMYPSREAKLARFTEVPSGHSHAADVVIVVPPQADLRPGFAMAHKLLKDNAGVRLVGTGVTLPRAWPSWVRSAKGLSLTELGAYAHETQAEGTGPLRSNIRRWLDATFSDALPDFSANRAFYGAAAMRCFQPMLDAYPLAVGLLASHPTATFVCSADWAGWRVMRALRSHLIQVRGLGARVRNFLVSATWKPRIFVLGGAIIAGAIAVVTRDYRAARYSRERLRRLRAGPKRAVKTWIAVVPDWPRINWHILDAVAKRELRERGTLGVLLIHSLAPGERSEVNLASHGTALWPGIAPIARELDGCVVDQAVLPEDPIAFLRAALATIRGAGSTLLRLANRRWLDIDGATVDLAPDAGTLVRLATVDVARGAMAAEAARALILRHDFRDLPVLFGAAGPTAMSTVDLALQKAGATTYHFAHGCHFDDPVGGGEHSATIQCAWTQIDARCRAGLREKVLVAGMPARLKTRRCDATRQSPHVLILSGYSHRDQNRARLEIFQDELLDVVRLLLAAGEPTLHFRWRPHPADSRQSVQRTRNRLGLTSLEISWAQPLETDVQWADIIVSNLSTVVSECLLDNLPVFVHHLPQVWGLPATTFLDPARTFIHAEDGAHKIRNYLAKPDDAPERRARIALWGPSGRPTSLFQYIHPEGGL